MGNQPTGFESKVSDAIIRALQANAVIAAVLPKKWNSKERVTLPRSSIKVSKGTEELVYRSGIYRAAVQIEFKVRKKTGEDDSDDLASEAEKELCDNPLKHEEITNQGFHFYVIERGGVAGQTEGKIRTSTLTFAIVGVEL